jgi:hypothetical protein
MFAAPVFDIYQQMYLAFMQVFMRVRSAASWLIPANLVASVPLGRDGQSESRL